MSMYGELIALIEQWPKPFYQVKLNEPHGNWKISVQGKTMEDLATLITMLMPFLVACQITHKWGTPVLMKNGNSQQRHKLLTIYCPENLPIVDLAKFVAFLTTKYTGGHGIKPLGYTMYNPNIWFRNDRDENGNYVMPYDPKDLEDV